MTLSLPKAFGKLTLMGILSLSATKLQAQLTGTKTIPTDYLTIEAFITDLNAQGVGAGGVILTVPAGYTEIAPAGGYQITATGTATDPVSILGGGMPKPIITANAALTAGNLNDGIFVLVGSDYVTIDGLELHENAANTTIAAATNNMTEWGIALVYASATNGAQHNTISNNTITLNKTYTNTFGIYSNTRHTLAAPTVSADITSASGSNSFNKVYGNAISNVNLGITFIGSNIAANMDAGNDIGGPSALTGNTITNWGTAAATSSYVSNSGTIYGILMNHQTGENVSYNTITSATVSGTAVAFRGILKAYTTTAPAGTFTSTISNNTITMTSGFTSGAFECIASTGMVALSTATLNINNNTLLNCSIVGAASSSAFVGIVNSSAPGTLSISNNVIQGTTSTATSGGFTGISNTGAVTASVVMNGNQIGNSTGGAISFSASNSGAFAGITNTGGVAPSFSLSNNNFQGVIYNGGGSAAVTFINHGIVNTTSATSNINNNTFTNLTLNTTGSTVFIIRTGDMSATGVENCNNNAIVTAFNKTGAGGTVTFYTANASSVNGSLMTQMNNNFSNITVTGATTIAGWSNTEGASSSNGPTKNVTGNTFTNITGGSSGITGMALNFGGTTNTTGNTISTISGTGNITGLTIGSNNGGATQNYSNNTVTGLVSSGTGGTVAGITGGSSSVTTVNINNNIINTFSSTGASSNVTGIAVSTGATVIVTGNAINAISGSGASTILTGVSISGGTTVNVNTNNIYALSGSGITSPAVRGIAVSSGTTVQVNQNKVYDLAQTGAISTTTGAVTGISLSGGTTVNTYNNVIGNLTAPAAGLTDAIRGIAVTSTATSTTHRIYYNTIYLNATSAGANFGTSGIFHTVSSTATTATLDLRNNIVINESTANGTGLTVAYRRSGTALNNYATTSNRNLFYAGVSSASNLVFTDGTTPQPTLAGYKTVVAARDANSATGESFTYNTAGSFFLSLTGSSVDYLKPVAGIASQTEGGAQQITTPAITVAFDGTVRAGNIGYTGTGTNPDMGAFEFEGISPLPVITFNSITPSVTPLCVTTPRLVSVNVTTVVGTITGAVLNYSFNGVAQAPVTMTNTSGSTWEGSTTVASPVNALVTWTVTATNSLGLAVSYSGTNYQDEPAFGITSAAQASATTICAGSPTDLIAKITSTGTVKVGNATTLTLDTEQPTAFCNRWSSFHLQQTYTVAELTALGLSAGPITSIGFEITTLGDAANNTNFILKMGPIASTTLTDFAPTGSMTTVFPSATYVHAIGVNMITFSTPYIWDGTSNIIIDMTHSGINSTNNSKTYYTATAANQTAYSTNGAATGTLSLKRLNTYFNGKVTSNATTVSWSDGVTTVGTTNPLTVNPTAATTYTATINHVGCPLTPSPSVTVNVNPLPSAPTASNSVQCGTQTPTASIVSTTVAISPTFKWYSAPTGGSVLQTSTATTFTSTVSATTTFYVAEVDAVTLCESNRTPVTVTVSAADPVSAGVDFASICIGSSVELTGSNTNPSPNQNYTYSWLSTTGSGAETTVAGTVVTITPTAPGTYTYNLAAIDGGCNAVSAVNVTVNPFVATLTAINATCNGVANGSFSLNTSACGTMPYTYSVDGSAFGAIPTNLAAGSHNVIIKDDNTFQTSVIAITIGEPSTTIGAPTATGIAICQDDLSGQLAATALTNVPAPASLVVSFNLAAQPSETFATPGVIISTAVIPALPAGSVITGLTLTSNGLVPHGGEYQTDVRLGLSGIFTNTAVAGTGLLGLGTVAEVPYNYTRSIPVSGFPVTGGALNVIYWNNVNDVTSGSDCTFPTGPSAITLTINYTTPTPANITWWDAPTSGTQLGSGSPFESVGTSVVPNTATPGTYTLYAGGEFGGCASPSRTAVNVTINEPTTSTVIAGDCDSYTLNGTTYTATGIYTQVVNNVAGCDSTITLNLTIYGPSISTTPMNACGSFTWTDGNVYNASGTYTQNLTGVNGCDSIATLELTINDNASTTTINNCGTYTWTDGNDYALSGTYTQNLTNMFGCDSIATLDLTIVAPTSATITDAACGSYALNGQTYTSSGTYVQSLTNVAGCDSMLTLNLTISDITVSSTVATECDAYVWTDGNTYTVSGVYTQNLTSVAGCDSTLTLTLTIDTTPNAIATDNGDATITASTGADYQWIDCGTNLPLTGETAQTLNVIANGDYAVVVSNGNCSDTSNCVSINYVGFEEQDAAGSVVIYPNPTRDRVVVTFNTATAYVEVYDAQGKLLTTALIDSGSEVNLSEYERGIYYLKVRSEKATSTHRVVKN